MRNYIYLLILLTFFSCEPGIPKNDVADRNDKKENPIETEDINYEWVYVKSDYKIQIPDFYKSSPKLNEEADFVYMNISKVSAIIGLSEDKIAVDTNLNILNFYRESDESLIDTYANFQMKNQDKAMYNITRSIIKDTNFNGLDARQFMMQGFLTDVKIRMTYFTTIIEDDDNLYTLICSCKEEDFDKFKKIFYEVIKSMKVFKHKKLNNSKV